MEFDVENGLRSFGKGFTILEDSLGRELTREEQVLLIADEFANGKLLVPHTQLPAPTGRVDGHLPRSRFPRRSPGPTGTPVGYCPQYAANGADADGWTPRRAGDI